LIVLVLSYGSIISYVTNQFAIFASSLTFLSTEAVFSILVPISLLVGVGIGFFGSFITVRRNLNV